jgi:hypothetical protein
MYIYIYIHITPAHPANPTDPANPADGVSTEKPPLQSVFVPLY